MKYEKTGVVGLGLIGGSMCRALKKYGEREITGFDLSEKVMKEAYDAGAIDHIGDEAALQRIELLFLALYPHDCVEYVRAHAARLQRGVVIIDLCGVKSYVCEALTQLAAEHGFVYIGAHPMAGREFSGFSYSQADLFRNAAMILTPTQASAPEALSMAEALFYKIGFTKIVHTTPENHDKMIAFTSQLAHVVSSAYIKSPEASRHNGYSAGSYKDLTRVAKLNETMWTELFLENADYLVEEIDGIIRHLSEYRNSIAARDAQTLKALLRDGRIRKEKIDFETGSGNA